MDTVDQIVTDAKDQAAKEVTAEKFAEIAPQKGEVEQEKPAADKAVETDFEKFLNQFPEADANSVVKGAIESKDFTEGCFTRQYVRSLKSQIDELKAENESEEAITQKALASGKVTETIVKEYLKAVAAKQSAIRNAPVGRAPVVPPAKPKTFGEAGVLAGDIFKNNND